MGAVISPKCPLHCPFLHLGPGRDAWNSDVQRPALAQRVSNLEHGDDHVLLLTGELLFVDFGDGGFRQLGDCIVASV